MFEAFAAVVLLLLLVLAGGLMLRLRALTAEAQALKRDMATVQAAQRDLVKATEFVSTRPMALLPGPATSPDPVAHAPATGFAEPGPEAAPRADPDPATPTLPALGATRRATAPGQLPLGGDGSQGVLPLQPDPGGGLPPLPLDVLIRALQFPETEEDTEGFRALRRALRDHRAGQLIQAAQDVLTLLSQDGLYMDDLPPDRARPEMWRRFAQGERGGQISALGGIRDRSSIAVASGRMRDDPVFRDATHHFLRRFDRMLADIEPEASDPQIAALSDTRTTRAFMLLGRVMGIFD